MKNFARLSFCLLLAAICVVGASLTFAPDAQAGSGCPPCYVPSGASGWTQYGSCTDYSDPHCPLAYRTYQNNYTGQICRGQNPVAPV